MTITGRAIDKETGKPIPKATAALRNGFVTLAASAANDDGIFTVSTNQAPDSILLTSVGYEGQFWPLPEYSDTTLFSLPKFVKPMDEVIITVDKKKNWIWFLVFGATLLIANRKTK